MHVQQVWPGPELARPAPVPTASAVRTPRPVLVVGSSRSGTSVTAALIGLHSRATTVHEVHFFENSWTPASRPLTFEQSVDLAERLVHHAADGFYRPFVPGARRAEATRLVTAAGAPTSGVDVYRAVLAHCSAGADLVVDQTPRYVYWLEEILAAMPEALVVRLVRDPLDVLLSQKNWWRTLRRAAGDVPARIAWRHRLQYHPVVMSLLWRSAYLAGEAVDDPRVLTVQFERLLRDPGTEVRRICEHLGIPFEHRMLAVPAAGSSNRSALTTGHGLDATVSGLGAERLSAAEVWISRRITRGASAGAEPGRPSRPPVLGLAVWAVRLPFAGLVALAANRGRTHALAASARRRFGVGGDACVRR